MRTHPVSYCVRIAFFFFFLLYSAAHSLPSRRPSNCKCARRRTLLYSIRFSHTNGLCLEIVLYPDVIMCLRSIFSPQCFICVYVYTVSAVLTLPLLRLSRKRESVFGTCVFFVSFYFTELFAANTTTVIHALNESGADGILTRVTVDSGRHDTAVPD